MEIREITRGKPKLCFGGYAYIVDKRVNDRFYWKCEQYGECGGRAVTVGDSSIGNHVLQSSKEHNHLPDSTRSDVLQARSEIKKKALQTTSAPIQIVQQVSSGLNAEAQQVLPNGDVLRKVISRKRSSLFPPEPTSLTSLVVEDPFRKIDGQREFLQYDDTSPHGTRVLIFATSESLGHLSQATTILCDGTFKTVPRQFYQLYTFHGVKEFQGRNISFPFAYSLLSSKTEDAYLHLFNALLLTCQRHGFVLSPGFIITDFEIAAINALRQLFQSSVLHGCFFHLSQNVYRQVQKTGLQAQYANDAAFSSLVRQLCALSFLPPHRIRQGYAEIKPHFPPQADKLLEWFEKHYVMGRARTLQNGLVIRAPPLFPPSLWSVQPLMDLGQPRGNNSVEGWHSRFLKLVGGAHRGFWKFLTCIAAEHQLTEDKLEAMLRSQEPPRQKKAIAARNEKGPPSCTKVSFNQKKKKKKKKFTDPGGLMAAWLR
ncbi:hypothetical protein ISCGN_012272 [Ixodes scapularis]